MQSKLDKYLRQYAAGATAILATGVSQAEIVYVNVNPDHGVGMSHNTQVNEYYEIMIDGDTALRVGNYHGYSSFSWLRNELWVENGDANGNAQNAVAINGNYFTDPYDSTKNGYFASALSSGNIIGMSDSFDPWGWLAIVSYWTSGTMNGGIGKVGEFENTTDKYVGVRIDLNGQMHYGWLRFSVSSSLNGFSFLDYAYQTLPNTPIKAGESADILPTDNITLSVSAAGSGYNPDDITIELAADSNSDASEYRVFIVKQSTVSSFTADNAFALDSTRFFSVDTSLLSWQQQLSTQILDTDGDALISGQGYVAIALLLPDGINANTITLSQPSGVFLTEIDNITGAMALLPKITVSKNAIHLQQQKGINAFQVIDLSGKICLKAKVNSNTSTIPHQLKAGIYIVEMDYFGEKISQKIVVN